jgi:CRISPR-associated protein Cas2
MEERLYVVAYDIADQKRWRRIFNIMSGHGERLQLSIFQCRLSRRRHAALIAVLDGVIHHKDDHIILIDLGPADEVQPRVVSLGKDFQPLAREPIIV